MAEHHSVGSIGALIGRLVEDTRAFVGAQIALYKAQASAWAGEAKFVAIYAVVALVLVHGAIIALFVGLVLTLQTRVGPGWATLIVVAGTLLIAAMFGWLAYRHVRKLTSPKSAA